MQITSRACPCPRVTRVGLEVLDSAMRQLLYSMCSRLWTTEVAGGRMRGINDQIICVGTGYRLW